MKLVDVHCHLDDSRFKKDFEEVLERFKKGGGRLIITSGVDSKSNRVALELSKSYDFVRASFGIYPMDALAAEIKSGEAQNLSDNSNFFNVDEELAWIEEHKNDCVAIGEIGLDYSFFSKDDLGGTKEFQSEKMKEKQKEVFRKCLRMAKKIGKTVVIHSRKAEEDAIKILEEEGMENIVMHCFSGKKSLIRRIIENGWYFSVPAVISRLEHFKMLVEMVPLGQLLTESDGAYLSPVAGTRNEPKNVLVTLREIARIKNLTIEEVAGKIWENSIQLFKL